MEVKLLIELQEMKIWMILIFFFFNLCIEISYVYEDVSASGYLIGAIFLKYEKRYY